MAGGDVERLDQPLVVATTVERHDDGVFRREGEALEHLDLVAVQQRDVGPKMVEVVDELCRHPDRCRAGQDPHRSLVVGECRDDSGETFGIDAGQGAGDVALFGGRMATDEIVRAQLSDALGGRQQLCREFVPNRLLQRDEAFVAELGRQADDGRRAGICSGGDLGDRAEGDDLRCGEHDVGDLALGRGERITVRLQARFDGHVPDASPKHPAAGPDTDRVTPVVVGSAGVPVSSTYRSEMFVSFDASNWHDPSIAAATTAADLSLSSDEGRAAADEALVRTAARLSATLPQPIGEALVDFADHPERSGALLLRNVPVGTLPPTPASPDTTTTKDLTTELTLLAVARRLGQPVGYAPEHGGRIVQNLVPTEQTANLQMSTSSRSNLMFHTETAFHPHRPRYLALFCLRGNTEAHTTMASIFDIVDHLPAATRTATIDAMFEARFRTSVDASFLQPGSTDELGAPHPLLTGTLAEPTFLFDADLTVGIDADAERALDDIRAAVVAATTSVILAPGDLLVIDNNRAVHGRSPFTARFDGTDRWLQRAFIVSDLAPSAADRRGRVIMTQFGRTQPIG